MKYTYYEKKDPKDGWSRWFAWRPIPIGRYPLKDGQAMVWLEWVERKWLDSREGSDSYEYRLPKPRPTSKGTAFSEETQAKIEKTQKMSKTLIRALCHHL